MFRDAVARTGLLRSTAFSGQKADGADERLAFVGSEQARAISWADGLPLKIGSIGGVWRFLRASAASRPSVTNLARTRSIMVMLVSSASAMRPSVQPSPGARASAFNKMRAVQQGPCRSLALGNESQKAYSRSSCVRSMI